MTNEVVLNRLNELRSTIALSDPDSASAIDSLLAKGVDAPRGSGIFAVEFVSFMREVCEDIRKAQSKANGKGDQRRALVRILKLARDKSSERPVLHNPFMNGGKQWFVSGYHGVGLNTPMEWEKCSTEENAIDMTRIAVKFGEPIELPDLASLKTYIKMQKAEKRKRIVYSYGYVTFDAQQMVDVMEALPGAIAYHDGSKFRSAYFESQDGIGLLLPLRMAPGDEIVTKL